jgi:hypothetical protein
VEYGVWQTSDCVHPFGFLYTEYSEVAHKEIVKKNAASIKGA